MPLGEKSKKVWIVVVKVGHCTVIHGAVLLFMGEVIVHYQISPGR